jgi:hypothetical protein
VPLISELDPAAYDDLTAATRGCQRLPVTSVSSFSRPTSDVYRPAAKSTSLVQAITAQQLNADPASNSSRWSQLILQGVGRNQPPYHPVFPVGSGPFARPRNPAAIAGPVYEVGRKTVGCPTDYAITAIKVTFDNLVQPKGWAVPTDAGQPTTKLDLALFVNQPWYHGLIGNEIEFALKARCEYFPTVTR